MSANKAVQNSTVHHIVLPVVNVADFNCGVPHWITNLRFLDPLPTGKQPCFVVVLLLLVYIPSRGSCGTHNLRTSAMTPIDCPCGGTIWKIITYYSAYPRFAKIWLDWLDPHFSRSPPLSPVISFQNEAFILRKVRRPAITDLEGNNRRNTLCLAVNIWK